MMTSAVILRLPEVFHTSVQRRVCRVAVVAVGYDRTVNEKSTTCTSDPTAKSCVGVTQFLQRHGASSLWKSAFDPRRSRRFPRHPVTSRR